MIQSTSLETYGIILKDLPSLRQMILSEIKKHPDGITLKETAMLFGVHPNDISGRFTELRDKNLIYRDGKRYTKNKYGRNIPSFIYKVVQ